MRTFFLGSIFVLSMLAAAYVPSEIVLPLIFAVAGKRPLGRGRATGPPRRKPDDRDGLALQRSGGTGSPPWSPQNETDARRKRVSRP
jgi:hypothetical protein